MKHLTINMFVIMSMLAAPLLQACSDDNTTAPTPEPEDTAFGKANDVFSAEEWYSGGQLGTTEEPSYADPAPAVTNTTGMEAHFNKGEDFFEHVFTLNEEPRKGLGPAWVRNSCIACHPGYGHGKRMDRYSASDGGNGYLLVVYHPTAGTDADGVAYAANSYIRHVTGMPQTRAMSPFKAPIEEDGIHISWLTATDEHGNRFADGETYTLSYPEVTIDQSAFNTDPLPDNYEVRLESTIGIYGSGLLDAIDQDDMKAQYQLEASHGAQLNPGMWDAGANDWAASAWYTLADGSKRIKKFTYAMTRASLQDGPGANAIWNITNVNRSDRHYLYTDAAGAWAKAQSEDPEVIKYIQEHGESSLSVLHPYYGDGTEESIKERVKLLLDLPKNTEANRKVFEDNLMPFGEEMSDEDYYDLMVWHRGLAVPAARNLDKENVKRGKTLFYEMGCTQCHRPSWTTREDNYWVDNSIKAYAASTGQNPYEVLPKYPNQTIWPYTDLVQHRLFMVNDIRTGWCRTTPLWGRGLSMRRTQADDRLHDCRAKTVVEAIMWHGYSRQSDAYQHTQKFYNLPKEDRDAVVAFIEAI